MTQICQWAPTDSMCKRSHMVVRAKVCELTDGFLWFVCGLFVRILTSPLNCLYCFMTSCLFFSPIMGRSINLLLLYVLVLLDQNYREMHCKTRMKKITGLRARRHRKGGWTPEISWLKGPNIPSCCPIYSEGS